MDRATALNGFVLVIKTDSDVYSIKLTRARVAVEEPVLA
jgi:hypothetical protein